MEEVKRPPIRFGIFEVDLHAGELRRQGVKVKLQQQPFELLAMLLERPGEVVTREEIQKRLWPADTFVDFDRGLNRATNRLRESLADEADSPRFIETLPRRGYRFIAPVAKLDESGHVLRPTTPTRVLPHLTFKWKARRVIFKPLCAMRSLGFPARPCATRFATPRRDGSKSRFVTTSTSYGCESAMMGKASTRRLWLTNTASDIGSCGGWVNAPNSLAPSSNCGAA